MKRETVNLKCPLCGSCESNLFHADRNREYFQCAACSLVFVPPAYFLSPEEEKVRYDLHQNDPTDTGYRRFLNNLMEPVAGSLSPGAEGLDYGCGPGPTLSLMFREAGFYCADYDPFYAPDPVVLERQYDFLTCSEVIEHCHYPMKEFDRFLRLVRPGGVIGVMTQLVRDQAAFAKWHYIDDETHVCFFSEETFQWLGNYLDIEVVSHKKSVTLFCV